MSRRRTAEQFLRLVDWATVRGLGFGLHIGGLIGLTCSWAWYWNVVFLGGSLLMLLAWRRERRLYNDVLDAIVAWEVGDAALGVARDEEKVQ